MQVRKNLDITWRDLLYGFFSLLSFKSPKDVTGKIEALWKEESFVCFSVRTGFDLLLRELALPEGSEVVVSPVTIPGMIDILLEHNLVPVPADLDRKTLSITLKSLKEAVSPGTKAVLLTSLFGSFHRDNEVISWIKENNLLLFEDFAQCFHSTEGDKHPDSDAAFYSFGSLKFATALGGAVICLKDRTLKQALVKSYSQYRIQPRGTFCKKLIKYSFLKLLSLPFFYTLLVKAVSLSKRDSDALIHSWTRGFPGKDPLKKMRYQCSLAQLTLLLRRLKNYSVPGSSISCAELLQKKLRERFFIPGLEAQNHYYWVFPVQTDKRDSFTAFMRSQGFDVSSRSSMVSVKDPEGRGCSQAETLMNSLVFLPLMKKKKDILRLCESAAAWGL